MSFDDESKAIHTLTDAFLPGYEFGVFVNDARKVIRNFYEEGPTSRYFNYSRASGLYTPACIRPGAIMSGIDNAGIPVGGSGYTGGETIQQWHNAGRGPIDMVSSMDGIRRIKLSESRNRYCYVDAETSTFPDSWSISDGYPTNFTPKLMFAPLLLPDSEYGSTTVDPARYDRSYYGGCQHHLKAPLADWVLPIDTFRGSEVGLSPTNIDSLRAFHMYAAASRGLTGGSDTHANTGPYEQFLRSMQFIAVGLPPFDDFGFLDIKNFDFDHYQQNRLAGVPYQDFKFGFFPIETDSGYESCALNIEHFYAAMYPTRDKPDNPPHAFRAFYEGDASGAHYGYDAKIFTNMDQARKHAPNYFVVMDYPGIWSEFAFRHYINGHPLDETRFAYAEDDDLYGLWSKKLHKLNRAIYYKYDISSTPYARFELHYDMEQIGMNASYWSVPPLGGGSESGEAAFEYIGYQDLHPAAVKTRGETSFDDSDALRHLRIVVAYLCGESPFDPSVLSPAPLKYNLECSTGGRLPPLFMNAAKADRLEFLTGHQNQWWAFTSNPSAVASFDSSVVEDVIEGIDNKTAAVNEMVKYSLQKMFYPRPWDGTQLVWNFRSRSSHDGGGAAFPLSGEDHYVNLGGSALNLYDITSDGMSHITSDLERSGRERFREAISNREFIMYWGPLSPSRGSAPILNGCQAVYENSLKLFLGTRELNSINALTRMKKIVEHLTGIWTYDDAPAASRIRMQKGTLYDYDDFSTLQETLPSEGSLTPDSPSAPSRTEVYGPPGSAYVGIYHTLADGHPEIGEGLDEYDPISPDYDALGDLCFVAGTLVTMYDGTQRPIESIEVGEQVLSYNNGESSVGIVTSKLVYDIYDNVEVASLEGIVGNPIHPLFYNNEWISMIDHPKATILKKYVDKYYNLEIDGDNIYDSEHNFVIGEQIFSGLGDSEKLNSIFCRDARWKKKLELAG